MKKITMLLAACAAVLLGGCAEMHGHHGGYPGPDTSRPRVLIDAGTPTPSISVAPRTLVFLPEQRNVEIVWTLPKAEGSRQLRFAPGSGVVISGEVKYRVQTVPAKGEGRLQASGDGSEQTYLDPKQDEIVECRGSADGLEYRCLNRHTRPGYYKYAIQLTDGQHRYVIDPLVDNW